MKRLFCLFLLLSILPIAGYGQSEFTFGDTGAKVLGSYFKNDIDSVSLTNGNLNVNIPIFSLPGREIPLTLGMTYNSQAIQQRTSYDDEGDPTNYWEFYGWRKAAPLGGSLKASMSLQNPDCALPSCTTMTWSITIQWTKGDGTVYSWSTTRNQDYVPDYWDPDTCEEIPGYWYPSTGELYDNRSIDMSNSEFLHIDTGTFFDSSPTSGAHATVYDRNGTQMIFYNNVPGISWEVRSPNGNRLQASGTTTSSTTHDGSLLYDVVPLSDTTSRTISYSSTSTTETYTLTDANGSAQVYTITWENVSGHGPDTSGSPTFRVVQSIGLPNGKSYQFTYDSNGLLSKITYPSGAYVRYNYELQPVTSVGFMTTSRIVSSDGTSGTEHSWGYSYSFSEYADDEDYIFYSLASTEVTTPTDTETHYFTPVTCSPGAACAGLDTMIQNSGSPALKEVDVTWSTSSNANVQSVVISLLSIGPL